MTKVAHRDWLEIELSHHRQRRHRNLAQAIGFAHGASVGDREYVFVRNVDRLAIGAR